MEKKKIFASILMLSLIIIPIFTLYSNLPINLIVNLDNQDLNTSLADLNDIDSLANFSKDDGQGFFSSSISTAWDGNSGSFGSSNSLDDCSSTSGWSTRNEIVYDATVDRDLLNNELGQISSENGYVKLKSRLLNQRNILNGYAGGYNIFDSYSSTDGSTLTDSSNLLIQDNSTFQFNYNTTHKGEYIETPYNYFPVSNVPSYRYGYADYRNGGDQQIYSWDGEWFGDLTTWETTLTFYEGHAYSLARADAWMNDILSLTSTNMYTQPLPTTVDYATRRNAFKIDRVYGHYFVQPHGAGIHAHAIYFYADGQGANRSHIHSHGIGISETVTWREYVMDVYPGIFVEGDTWQLEILQGASKNNIWYPTLKNVQILDYLQCFGTLYTPDGEAYASGEYTLKIPYADEDIDEFGLSISSHSYGDDSNRIYDNFSLKDSSQLYRSIANHTGSWDHYTLKTQHDDPSYSLYANGINEPFSNNFINQEISGTSYVKLRWDKAYDWLYPGINHYDYHDSMVLWCSVNDANDDPFTTNFTRDISTPTQIGDDRYFHLNAYFDPDDYFGNLLDYVPDLNGNVANSSVNDTVKYYINFKDVGGKIGGFEIDPNFDDWDNYVFDLYDVDVGQNFTSTDFIDQVNITIWEKDFMGQLYGEDLNTSIYIDWMTFANSSQTPVRNIDIDGLDYYETESAGFGNDWYKNEQNNIVDNDIYSPPLTIEIDSEQYLRDEMYFCAENQYEYHLLTYDIPETNTTDPNLLYARFGYKINDPQVAKARFGVKLSNGTYLIDSPQYSSTSWDEVALNISDIWGDVNVTQIVFYMEKENETVGDDDLAQFIFDLNYIYLTETEVPYDAPYIYKFQRLYEVPDASQSQPVYVHIINKTEIKTGFPKLNYQVNGGGTNTIIMEFNNSYINPVRSQEVFVYNCTIPAQSINDNISYWTEVEDIDSNSINSSDLWDISYRVKTDNTYTSNDISTYWNINGADILTDSYINHLDDFKQVIPRNFNWYWETADINISSAYQTTSFSATINNTDVFYSHNFDDSWFSENYTINWTLTRIDSTADTRFYMNSGEETQTLTTQIYLDNYKIENTTYNITNDILNVSFDIESAYSEMEARNYSIGVGLLEKTDSIIPYQINDTNTVGPFTLNYILLNRSTIWDNSTLQIAMNFTNNDPTLPHILRIDELNITGYSDITNQSNFLYYMNTASQLFSASESRFMNFTVDWSNRNTEFRKGIYKISYQYRESGSPTHISTMANMTLFGLEYNANLLSSAMINNTNATSHSVNFNVSLDYIKEKTNHVCFNVLDLKSVSVKDSGENIGIKTPTITINEPTDEQEFITEQTITIKTTTTDLDNNIILREYRLWNQDYDSGWTSLVWNSPYWEGTINPTTIPNGEYFIDVRVQDSTDNWANDSINITIIIDETRPNVTLEINGNVPNYNETLSLNILVEEPINMSGVNYANPPMSLLYSINGVWNSRTIPDTKTGNNFMGTYTYQLSDVLYQYGDIINFYALIEDMQGNDMKLSELINDSYWIIDNGLVALGGGGSYIDVSCDFDSYSDVFFGIGITEENVISTDDWDFYDSIVFRVKAPLPNDFNETHFGLTNGTHSTNWSLFQISENWAYIPFLFDEMTFNGTSTPIDETFITSITNVIFHAQRKVTSDKLMQFDYFTLASHLECEIKDEFAPQLSNILPGDVAQNHSDNLTISITTGDWDVDSSGVNDSSLMLYYNWTGQTPIPIAFVGGQANISKDDLIPHRDITYFINFTDNAGNPTQSPLYNVTILNDIPNSPPEMSGGNFVFTKADITISWQPVTDSNGDPMTYYIKVGSFWDGGDIMPLTNLGSQTAVNLWNLTLGTYYFEIFVSDGYDNSTSVRGTIVITTANADGLPPETILIIIIAVVVGSVIAVASIVVVARRKREDPVEVKSKKTKVKRPSTFQRTDTPSGADLSLYGGTVEEYLENLSNHIQAKEIKVSDEQLQTYYNVVNQNGDHTQLILGYFDDKDVFQAKKGYPPVKDRGMKKLLQEIIPKIKVNVMDGNEQLLQQQFTYYEKIYKILLVSEKPFFIEEKKELYEKKLHFLVEEIQKNASVKECIGCFKPLEPTQMIVKCSTDSTAHAGHHSCLNELMNIFENCPICEDPVVSPRLDVNSYKFKQPITKLLLTFLQKFNPKQKHFSVENLKPLFTDIDVSDLELRKGINELEHLHILKSHVTNVDTGAKMYQLNLRYTPAFTGEIILGSIEEETPEAKPEQSKAPVKKITPVAVGMYWERQGAHYKLAVKTNNHTKFVISEVDIRLDIAEQFAVRDVKGLGKNIKFDKTTRSISIINLRPNKRNIEKGMAKTVNIILNPLLCITNATIEGTYSFRDHENKLNGPYPIYVDEENPPAEINVSCPIAKKVNVDEVPSRAQLENWLQNHEKLGLQIVERKWAINKSPRDIFVKMQNTISLKDLSTAVIPEDSEKGFETQKVAVVHSEDVFLAENYYYGVSAREGLDIIVKLVVDEKRNSLTLTGAMLKIEGVMGLIAEYSELMNNNLRLRDMITQPVVNKHLEDYTCPYCSTPIPQLPSKTKVVDCPKCEAKLYENFLYLPTIKIRLEEKLYNILFGVFHQKNGPILQNKLPIIKDDRIDEEFMNDAISFKFSKDKIQLQTWSDEDGFKKFGILVEVPDQIEASERLRGSIMQYCFVVIVSDDITLEIEAQIRNKLNTFDWDFEKIASNDPALLQDLQNSLLEE